MSEPQTNYPEWAAGLEPPESIFRNRRIGSFIETNERSGETTTGLLHLAGYGSKPADILFINPRVQREDTWTRGGDTARVLKGAPGNMFLRNLSRAGFKQEEWYYTCVIKYFQKQKHKATDLRWSLPALLTEVKLIKPKLIVSLGKLGFDVLYRKKYNLKDIRGGLFDLPEHDCLIYVMDSISDPVTRPENLERFMVDLQEVRRVYDQIRGIERPKVVQDYVVLNNSIELDNYLRETITMGVRRMSTDCEWDGQTAFSGQLRSIQFGRAMGQAAYVRMMDDKLNYVFDVNRDTVGQIIAHHVDPVNLAWIGHSFSSDAMWMHHHLGLKVYKRCCFDTMFAQKCINEYADMKLERLALKITDLGRYDIPLFLWKKDNKKKDIESGYGLVPDDILIPYALRDADATFRAFPYLYRLIIEGGLAEYFFSTLLPFVTDGFFELMDTGVPMNRDYMEKMRHVFVRNQAILMGEFRAQVAMDAAKTLTTTMLAYDTSKTMVILPMLFQYRNKAQAADSEKLSLESKDYQEAWEMAKDVCGANNVQEFKPIFDHWWQSPIFNPYSTDYLRRWLFGVKKYQPLKTTKKDGIQMGWDRVLALPPEKQIEYSPATDKNTIKVFAVHDPQVAQIQELKAVGNIVKAFLPPKLNEDDDERGLAKWIQPDERVHANFSLTDTDRPRTWNPNILNWPKFIAKPIEKAFLRINKRFMKEFFIAVKGKIPISQIRQQIKDQANIAVSVRSCAQAPEGYIFIDMDLKTAEIVALGYLSGDENLLKVLNAPDTQFARVKDHPKKVKRIAYVPGLTICSEDQWVKHLLTDPDDPTLLRDSNGIIIHPKRDMHWEMGEAVANKPRELLDEDMERNGVGKVGNFSIPYGAGGPSLERLVEANIGRKPEDGTGEKMRTAYSTRYPVAWRFLELQEQVPVDPGYYRAITGAIRHFHFREIANLDGLSEYTRKGLLNPLIRQARNYPMQHLVAATTAKALLMYREKREQMGLNSRIMMLLYDAMTALSTLEEAKASAQLLKQCLTVDNSWTVHGRTFNFEVDVDYAKRWGCKLTSEEKKLVSKYV